MLSKATFTPSGTDGNPNYNYNEQPVYLAGGYLPVPNLNTNGYFPADCSAISGTNILKDKNFPYWLSTLNDKVDLRVSYV